MTRRRPRLRRAGLWALLTFVLGSVVFSGASPAGAFVPPPPVVAPPIVAPPSAPDIPGVDEDSPVWCIWAPTAWGCPGNPEPPPFVSGNPYVGTDQLDFNWPGGVAPAGWQVVAGPNTAVAGTGGVVAANGPGSGPMSYVNGYSGTGVNLDLTTSNISFGTWYPAMGFLAPDASESWRVDFRFDDAGGGVPDKVSLRLHQGSTDTYTYGGTNLIFDGCNPLQFTTTRVQVFVAVETKSGPPAQERLYVGAQLPGPCAKHTSGDVSIDTGWVVNGIWDGSQTTKALTTFGGGTGAIATLPGVVGLGLYLEDLYPLAAASGLQAALDVIGGANPTSFIIPWEPTEPDWEILPEPETEPTPTTTTPGAVPSTIPEVEPPDPSLSPDTQGLIESIGGFFGDLIGALWNALAWLATQIWEAIKWLVEQLWKMFRWLYEALAALLVWLFGIIVDLLRQLLTLLGNLLNAIIQLLSMIWQAIISSIAWLGQIIISWIQWLVNALLAGIQVFFEWLLTGISLLFEWFLGALGDLLAFLFVPDISFDVWLDGLDADPEHPVVPWVEVFADNISFGAQCGPSFTLDYPIDHTFNIPAPSSSGCPGNGVGQARTQADNLAGDLWGYRVAARTFMAFLLVWFVGMRVLRSAPWANKGEMVDPEPDASVAVPT